VSEDDSTDEGLDYGFGVVLWAVITIAIPVFLGPFWHWVFAAFTAVLIVIAFVTALARTRP
jgi:hypothetical protein